LGVTPQRVCNSYLWMVPNFGGIGRKKNASIRFTLKELNEWERIPEEQRKAEWRRLRKEGLLLA